MHLCHAEDEEAAVCHVAQSQLSATRIERAVIAVPDEDRGSTGRDQHAAILDLVDLHLLRVVQHYQRAVLAVGDIKHLSSDATR